MPELIVIPDHEYDRRKYIGGSNVAAIVGVGATHAGEQQTPLTVYLSKIGEGDELTSEQKLFLARRKRFEGPIVEMLREEFKGNIVAVNRRYRRADCDFMAAELDFEWVDEWGEIQNGEIKTVSPWAFGERFGWGEEGSSDIPVDYAAQVHHGLGLTERKLCIVAAMVGLDTMLFYPIQRNDEVIGDMREACDWFWNQHVLKRIPPNPLNLEDSMKLALRIKGRPVEITDEMMQHLHDIARIRDTRKQLEASEHDLKFALLEHIRRAWSLDSSLELQDNAILRLRGRKVATYNMQTTTRIDGERLRAEQPDLAREYMKASTTRILRLSKS